VKRELPPSDADDVRVTPPARTAGGLAAVRASMRLAQREMGLVRSATTLILANQTRGFDCPGCAWPEADEHRASIEFCENGAKAIASEATLKRMTPELFAKWSVSELAAHSDEWLNAQGRLTHPMRLRPGGTHYEPIAWSLAFDLVARELRALASPDEAIFYTSGRTSNEAAFLYQLFVRQYGTNNLPDCSNMCHESSGAAMMATLGVGKSTVTLEDFDHADAIFIFGQNPGTNHPRMLSTLEAAAKRGCAIVGINPLSETGTRRFAHPQHVVDMITGGTALATLELRVRVNGDVALLQGIIKEILEAEARSPGAVLDRAFIRDHTSGFEAMKAAALGRQWNDLEEVSGITREEMKKAAAIAMKSERTIACWAMGLTQHKNGVANVQEVINFLLLRGNIGRPGAGACPVRGHSNVQGDRTMGIWEKMDDAFLDRLGRACDFEPPRRHGKDTVDSIRAMRDGDAKVFFAMGGNFLSATPDTSETARALARCRLTAHVSTKLHRGHLVTGAEGLIFPCLGRTEIDARETRDVESREGEPRHEFVTVENSMSVVHMSRGALPPASPELKSEVQIVCELARATLGTRTRVPWEELASRYDRIRDLIAQVVPGFEDFNARVTKPAGFHLPSAARARVFATDVGRAKFTVHALPRHALLPGQLMMMTIRSHDQYNTTVYGLDDRYRGIKGGRRVILLHREDIAAAGLEDGDLVDVTSHFRGEERMAPRFRVVAYDIPRRCAATYFPEANVLVPLDSVADESNTPTSKSIVVTVARSDAAHAPARSGSRDD
jgi:molybdopterin-dependent oxidoreductase alpha subunit